MANVSFTRHLKRFFPSIAPTQIDASTVAELVDALEIAFPGIKSYLVDDQGQLRKHVNVFVNNETIGDRKTLTDPLSSDDDVFVMQALSGG